jgi:phenylalanyl-tRNA synthetase alpha chain
MDTKTEYNNIPLSIEKLIGKNLHNKQNHPIEIMKRQLFDYFKTLDGYDFKYFDDLSPFVKIEDNFDKLLISSDHPARSKSDTYYVNETTVLRTHTTAHQNDLLSQGYNNFLVVGDVYRKDEIDCCHYPVFHQIEAVGKVPFGVDPQKELIRILDGLVKYLFPDCKYRTNPDYFPFTNPSFEYEVDFNGKWLEILGCGIVHPTIIKNNNLDSHYWAWGIGLERLVMIKFNIPDIRYLWSDHPRFIDQFSSGEIVKFKPYSELPTMYKDISFWINNENITKIQTDKGEKINKWSDENNFFELAREVIGNWIEQIKLMDEFVHPKKEITSRMYRIIFSPIDPSLTDPAKFTEKCNNLQDHFRVCVKEKLNVTLR